MSRGLGRGPRAAPVGGGRGSGVTLSGNMWVVWCSWGLKSSLPAPPASPVHFPRTAQAYSGDAAPSHLSPPFPSSLLTSFPSLRSPLPLSPPPLSQPPRGESSGKKWPQAAISSNGPKWPISWAGWAPSADAIRVMSPQPLPAPWHPGNRAGGCPQARGAAFPSRLCLKGVGAGSREGEPQRERRRERRQQKDGERERREAETQR